MIKSSPATILSAAARLAGDLTTDEDVVLAGTFEGALRTSRSLQITPSGSLRGEAHAESVLVLGRVCGPIHAADRIQLQAGAVVDGDITAQHVRIHDDAVFNGRCSICGPQAKRRQYLVPTVLQGLGEPARPGALAAVQDATTELLRDFGFEVEVRTDHVGGGVLRPIFRSREPVAYAGLREQLRAIERVLQEASRDGTGRDADRGHPSVDGEPLQNTGRDGARALIAALAQLRSGALMLGPVIVTRLEEAHGARLAVRVRQDSLPAEAPAEGATPDPGVVLLALQKAQAEVAQDLTASMRERGRGNGA
jgi:cytoskeletal protein CcmA (bactofilin family)